MAVTWKEIVPEQKAGSRIALLPDTFCCPQCHHTLAPAPTPSFACTHCGARYVAPGGIPVLMKDSLHYTAVLHAQYTRYLNAETKLIRKLQESGAQNPRRKNVLKNWCLAMEANMHPIKSLQGELKAVLLNEQHIALSDPSEEITYAIAFDYLRRDWCWLPEGELEIECIVNSIAAQLELVGSGMENVLLTGAGSGRLAWEMRPYFGQVYAMDKSVLMAWQFHQLFKEDIRFYEIHTKNLMNSSDGIRMLRASLLPPWEAEQPLPEMGPVTYFTGDALAAPLKDQSLSCILSVYFTDVVPLSSYIKEIKRLLKPGGLFIHFGPLDYHFEELTERLSANEVRALFYASGFEWAQEAVIPSTHLKSAVSMTSKIYQNWSFCAIRKPSEVPSSRLNPDSIVKLKKEIRHEARGSISDARESLKEVNLTLSTGETYEGAQCVLDLLRLSDGKKTVLEIVDMLGTEYDLNDDIARQEVMNLIQSLVDKDILHIEPC
jgi:carnosine N-methyltransferase